jgi:hypothetical protein
MFGFLRCCVVSGAVWSLALAVTTSPAAAAAPSAAKLLPKNTKGFITTHDVKGMSEAWDRTQYGQLMADPAMKPFVDDLRNQLRDRWAESRMRLGISWEDIEAAAGGEACSAVIRLPPAKAAAPKATDKKKPPQPKLPLPVSVILIDITGHRPQADAILARVRKDLLKQGAKERSETVSGVKISIFDAPASLKDSHVRTQSVYFVKDDVFCAGDELGVVKGIVGRLNGQAKDTLANEVAFQEVMRRCAADAGDHQPHARWFAVPLDFFEARRQMNSTPLPEGQPDYLTILRHQGYEGLLGAGGYLHFDAAEYDIYQRVSIYAPPPYQLAMRMLDFPNAAPYPPDAWVPADVASCASFTWQMQTAFDKSNTLVDEIYGGRDILKDSLESLRDDPNGARVDLQRGVIDNLGTRAWMIFDYSQPTTEDSEQRMFAAEVNNIETVAKTIEKFMRSDKAVKLHEIAGHDVWQIPPDEMATEDDEDVPDLVVEHPGLEKHSPGRKPLPGQEGDRLLSNSYVVVAHGHLMLASHIDLVKKMLRDASEVAAMSRDADYQRVNTQIEIEVKRRGWSGVCMRRFSRTDEEFRSSYELTRMGKMPQSQSILGQLLNGGRPEPAKGQTLEQRINASKLPPYDTARRYFGPSGWVGTSEPDGWFFVNFTLRKDAPIANAARRPR